jgi:phosphohistidine phosphatase
MKLLSILRHAKSSWGDSSLDDHDRPLNKRGVRDAPRMGELIRNQDLVPDTILSSTACRARETALAVAVATGFPDEVCFRRSLYGAAPDAYLDALRELPDDVDHAMVVGHNPGLEELVALVVGTPHTMPTAALAVVELPIDRWRDLGPPPLGSLRTLWRPRELGDQA